MSRALVARIERGHADRVAVHTLVRVAAAAGASISLRLLWHGEGLDRLLDAAHAGLVEWLVRWLEIHGWTSATEVSFNVDRERGSMDILAFHPATGSLLVTEVKSVVPDVQATLHGIDRKARVARSVARERGWKVTSVSRLLVVPDDRTSRRRVAAHQATFESALPARTVAVKRWLRAPAGEIKGVLFVSDVTQPSSRHRVGRSRATAERAPDLET